MAEELNMELENPQNSESNSDLEAAMNLLTEMKETLDAQSKEIVELKKANMKLALQTSGPSAPNLEDALYDAFLKK